VIEVRGFQTWRQRSGVAEVGADGCGRDRARLSMGAYWRGLSEKTGEVDDGRQMIEWH